MTETRDLQQEMFLQLRDKRLFEQARSYAFEYLDGAMTRGVFPADAAIENLSLFDESLPQAPAHPEEILRLLHEYGSPATVAQTGGRYFGFVCGGSVPVAMAAKWLSDVWDQNAALHVLSPMASTLEATCERWLVDLLDLPEETAAGLVSGTSAALLCGLAAARSELLSRQGWDVNARGLFGAPLLRVIVGDQAHATVLKALALLGLGRERVERVAVDAQGRIDAAGLPKLDDRCLVVAQAGNVNSGSFDPIDEICHRAQAAGAWVHVDGAFGLWAQSSRTRKNLSRGCEKADSWSVDAHKTLNAPYDCGIILCRRRGALVTAMQTTASYIQYSDKRDGMHYTPEMSRRARAVELWATLKALGRDGVEQLVDRLCDHAADLAERLRSRGFRVLNEVVFNQVLVACDSAELTQATLERIQRSEDCWCGGSVWRGEPVIRVSVCSWATTTEDIERTATAFVAARETAASTLVHGRRRA
ncbi:MAG: aminotransferase class V-fold PLP-dependent enzyme [Candidatus Bipolaricaulota bacterium]